jgi:hypothetical protein
VPHTRPRRRTGLTEAAQFGLTGLAVMGDRIREAYESDPTTPNLLFVTRASS